METPTVGQTSGFKARDIHTKFPTKSIDPHAINNSEFIGSFNPAIQMVFKIQPSKVYRHITPHLEPKLCPKCYAPMQAHVTKKGDIETGKGVKIGYTCNRGGTGCQNAKAKKHRNAQIVKASLERTPNPKLRHIEGVRLNDTMIHG